MVGLWEKYRFDREAKFGDLVSRSFGFLLEILHKFMIQNSASAIYKLNLSRVPLFGGWGW